ncbi:MAG TPA: hypothetical protein VHK04_08505, partial [Castellaniella sp.]|nr:hypothetical protein [Castellaniella sp.]
MVEPRKPLSRNADIRRRVLRLRMLIIAILLLAWQLLAQSGLFYQDVVLGLPDIAVGLYQLLLDPDFYHNLWVTLAEVIGASVIGTVAGLACGMLLGASHILERAFERYLYYLGPTPKIIFFPLMILW